MLSMEVTGDLHEKYTTLSLEFNLHYLPGFLSDETRFCDPANIDINSAGDFILQTRDIA